MAQVLIASEVQGFNSRFTGTTAYLRIWASENAYSFLGEQITGAPVDGQNWYQQYTCTVASGVVTIPIVTLPATTDSYPPNLTFTAVLYDENGARQNTKLSNFILDPDLLTATDDATIVSSVTVTAAGTSAAQGTYEYNGQYLLKAYYNLTGQADSTSLYAIRWNGTQWQITSSAGAVYYYSTEDVANPWDVETWVASTGVAPLPAVTQAPVEIACNWQSVFLINNTPCIPCGTDRDWLLAWLISYMNALSVPWASTIASGVGGKVYISKVPVQSNQPEAVGTNEWAWLGVDDSRYLYEWDGDLEAAITDIGSDEATLWVTSEDQYTVTGALQTSGLLTVGKAYEIADYQGAVTYLNNVDAGTGYAITTGVATTGGSGTGLTVDITAVSATFSIDGIEINNAGTGYRVGDVITVSGGGGNAKMYIAAVFNGNFTNVGCTFLGYPTNFANKQGTVFIATGTTPTAWGQTSLRPLMNVPANIHLAFSGTGTLRATGDGGLYIRSLRNPGDVQIFTTDGDGKIYVAPQAVTVHNLAWWAGMTPSADNTHEFTQLQESLSVGLIGGTASIPVGDWLTSQITWTSTVKVVGQGSDIDGNQKGTAIYPVDQDALYTGVFSVQQLFHSITFEDFILSTDDSATVNCFRFIAVLSTSENFTLNRIRFESISSTPGAVPSCVFKAEGSFQEFVNVNFIQCTWTCWDETTCVFWESTNSVAYFQQCQFRMRVESIGFYSPYAGYITFMQCEWRGNGDYTNLPLTTDRTITTALDLVSGDNTVVLNTDFVTSGAQWTREDLGGFISVAGVTWGVDNRTNTYITQLNTNFSAEVADAPNSSPVNQTVTVQYTGDYPENAYACISLVVHLCVNVFGSSDEAVNYFLVDNAADYNDTFNMYGSKVQGRMLFEGGSSSMNFVASEFYSGAFNSTGHDPIIRMLGGEISTEITPRYEEEYPFPNFRELLSAEVWHLCPNDIDVVTDTSTKMGDRRETSYNQIATPMQLIHRKQGGGPADTVPQLAILSGKNAGDPDKVQLQIGTAYPGSMLAQVYYDIYRSLTTGALVIEGNQAGFEGIYHNGYILADGSIKSTNAVEAVGYATGAGGVVTQATSKATAVTLNTVSGQITMNNAALNAGTTVFFMVNNTSVRTNDTPIVVHASGGTSDAYEVTCNTVSNLGGFRVGVKNVTGGNLSEAIVLNFNLFRGVGA